MSFKKYFILWVLLLSAIHFNIILFSVQEAQGIAVTYIPLYLYVTESKTYNNSDMYFDIINTKNISVQVECTVLLLENINVTIKLEWDTALLQVGEMKRNSYAAIVGSIYAVTIPFNIDCVEIVDNPDNENIIQSAVSVVNYIRLLGDLEASIVNIEITDQSNRPRDSFIILKYRENNSIPYSILKEFEASRFNGILPHGNYEILVKDIQTNRFASEVFDVFNTTNKQIILKLVGFNRFEILYSTFGVLGLNCTINNFVETLTNIEIFAELIFENDTISITNKEFRSEFPVRNNQELILWFPPLELTDGKYKIVGKIQSSELVIAEKGVQFSLLDIKNSSEEELPLIPILGIMFGLLAIIIIYKNKRGAGK